MSLQYPEERRSYNNHVGITRVHSLSTIFSEVGLRSVWYKPEHKGVDMKVYDGTRLCIVVEVTNWGRRSYMSSERASSIKENLEIYRCHKMLVCSFESNYETYKHYFSNITILNIGFQTNPYYNLLMKDGLEVSDKRPDTTETYLIERTLILAYLSSIGLLDYPSDYTNTISMYTTAR